MVFYDFFCVFWIVEMCCYCWSVCGVKQFEVVFGLELKVEGVYVCMMIWVVDIVVFVYFVVLVFDLVCLRVFVLVMCFVYIWWWWCMFSCIRMMVIVMIRMMVDCGYGNIYVVIFVVIGLSIGFLFCSVVGCIVICVVSGLSGQMFCILLWMVCLLFVNILVSFGELVFLGLLLFGDIEII